ncbi:SDR family NAD(P)-dependent oxidoreductase [Azohydromonas sediminis]|uniref:SDR family NAD(P)-dependent oxidoreductase n=1 Tax=Azohydromonas sediminis TaxID=2259674 RepID=UPI000E64C14F|nr:SDR family NAD(P)-dependent oxidoreductase [Azohydromonas sediminis]
MPLNPPITDWTRQVVWLVGASSGIGRATAAHLHALGARVVVSARNAAALDAFAAQHAGSLAIALDATDRDAMRTAAARIVEQHGRIDLAVYCAGHYKPMRATAFDLDDALRHQQVNYVGALHLLDAVLPHLIRQAESGQPAHLSLVSSVAGYRGLPKSLAYGPTKAALINLAETLYLDLHPLGVGVSVINPGFVDTPLTAQNEFRMPALIGSDEAARQIVAGWQKGRFEIHFPKRFTHALKALSVLSDGLYFAAIRRATGL